jgi:hypothetical protein
MIDAWMERARRYAPSYADRILAVGLWLEGLLPSQEWPPRPRPPEGRGLPRVDAPGSAAVSARTLCRQLNVRLRNSHYEELARAARRYSITPTTLARLFITRGLEAVEREKEA